MLIALVLLMMFLLCACKKEEEPEKKFEFKEDTVFHVNGIEVSKAEWNLYARPAASEVENLYGKEIWNFELDSDGTLFGEGLRDDIQKRIVTVKLIASKAGELGVSLSEDDKTEVVLSADAYMDKLSEDQKRKYGITKELVEKVYSDNKLATKVYEHLTLNVDTATDDSEVRHMVLRYMMFSKTYETREGETAFRSDDEIDGKRSLFEDIRESVANNDKASLKDAENEELVVTEIIADLKELEERLPHEDAGIVFWLRQGELSPIIETDEALFLFECVKVTDEDSTNAARVKVIESREQQVFKEAYDEWVKDVQVEKNESLWNTLADELR